LPDDVIEGGGIDIERDGQGRKRGLAGSTTAGIGQVLRGNAVGGAA
jgi:hypothetical protein